MTQREAKDWVSRELSEMLTQFGDSVSDVSHSWDGDSMKFQFKVSRIASFKGTLKVSDSDLDLNLLNIPTPRSRIRGDSQSRSRTLAGPEPACGLISRSLQSRTPEQQPGSLLIVSREKT